jgi:antirestriction protein ArdC
MKEKETKRPDWGALLVEALTSPGTLAECYSVFHEYSLGNRILAAIQLAMRGLPLAPIASFGKWKTLGRSVKKGEKAISLIMPLIISKKPETEEEAGDETEGSGNASADGTGGDKKGGFTIFVLKNHWFSLDQTEGAEYVPEVKNPAWDKAQALANLGITEERFELMDGNTQGYAVPGEKRLAVSPIAAMPWKTLFHEIAHCLMHSKETQMADGAVMTRSIEEAEAESVAYLCCATLGLPGLDEARGYIQDWLGSKERSEEFAKKSAARVFAAADKILKAGTKTSKEEEVSNE